MTTYQSIAETTGAPLPLVVKARKEIIGNRHKATTVEIKTIIKTIKKWQKEDKKMIKYIFTDEETGRTFTKIARNDDNLKKELNEMSDNYHIIRGDYLDVYNCPGSDIECDRDIEGEKADSIWEIKRIPLE